MGLERPGDMEAILAALTPLLFVVMLVLERVFPARPLPRVRGWLFKGIVLFILYGALGAALPAVAATLVGRHAPLDLSGTGTLLGGLIGYLVADSMVYVVHRTLHNVPFLWRWTHQMHHSAERLDVAGSNYFHPFDIVALMGTSVMAVTLLGLSPGAAALAGFLGFLAGTFQHMNVKTPRWLGFVVQRPEAHAVHHARGVHAYNYGNFPLWDIVLGTFRNPAEYAKDEVAGFWDGASSRWPAMLIGRDVGRP
jgi:sterol desaturase/sphingolipid hydroxylase (fatty acid hydroxylase superfamily)